MGAVTEMRHRMLQHETNACVTQHLTSSPRPKTELMAEAAPLRTLLRRVEHCLVDAYKSEGRR